MDQCTKDRPKGGKDYELPDSVKAELDADPETKAIFQKVMALVGKPDFLDS